MSDHWKMEADIEYCVPCGLRKPCRIHGRGAVPGRRVQHSAISLTPGHSGAFKVTVDGEVLWDKQVQGKSPHIMEVKDLKAKVANMIQSGAMIQMN